MIHEILSFSQYQSVEVFLFSLSVHGDLYFKVFSYCAHFCFQELALNRYRSAECMRRFTKLTGFVNKRKRKCSHIEFFMQSRIPLLMDDTLSQVSVCGTSTEYFLHGLIRICGELCIVIASMSQINVLHFNWFTRTVCIAKLLISWTLSSYVNFSPKISMSDKSIVTLWWEDTDRSSTSEIDTWNQL